MATTTTDADGNYSFNGLGDGIHRPGRTSPARLHRATEDPPVSTCARRPSPRSDPDVTNVNFGYAEDYTISGTAPRDKDRSGTSEQR